MNSKRKVAKASEDLPKGTLALPPCVPHTSRVYDRSTHPHRVPIVVTERPAVADGKPEVRLIGKGAFEPKRTVYYVHPEYRMPDESKDKLEDAVASHVRAWEFKGDETLHPFWAVKRLTEEERRRTQRAPSISHMNTKSCLPSPWAHRAVAPCRSHSLSSSLS